MLVVAVMIEQLQKVIEVQQNFNTYIYFIGLLTKPYVKIGVSRNVAERLLELQCGNPFQLVLLHMCPGNTAIEASLHHLLDKHRIRGEWFYHNQDVEKIINHLKRSSVHMKLITDD